MICSKLKTITRKMQEILTTKMMKNNAHGNQTKCNQVMQNEISHMKLHLSVNVINIKFKLIARNLFMYAREDGTIQMEIKCSNIKDDNKHANANEVLLCIQCNNFLSST
jgi:hypothetical protein